MKERGKVTKSHARGVVVLIFVVLIIQAGLFVFNSIGEYNRIDRNRDAVANQVSLPDKTYIQTESTRKSIIESNTKEIKKVPFYFDPNTIDMDGLIDLGLSKREARVIVNYRNKGGKFRQSEDLSKIYVLTKESYNKIKDYVVIKEEAKQDLKRDFIQDTLVSAPVVQKSLEAKRIIDINSADSIDLISLPGIGPYFARKIIDYRTKLGGFANSEQLMDIYGIDKERYSIFCDRVWVDRSRISKIKLSDASADDLAKNPYIGAYIARSIVKLRESAKNNIITVASLVVNKIIKEEVAKILEYYLE